MLSPAKPAPLFSSISAFTSIPILQPDKYATSNDTKSVGDQADMAHVMEVRPTIAAVANRAEPAAKIEVAVPGYGLLDPPLDEVGDVVVEVPEP
jgi:hypothetical protein